jgi:hypothetical protein
VNRCQAIIEKFLALEEMVEITSGIISTGGTVANRINGVFVEFINTFGNIYQFVFGFTII